MFINCIIIYFVLGLLVNCSVSEFDKIEIHDDLKEPDKAINPHLVILLWPVLVFGIFYCFIKMVKK